MKKHYEELYTEMGMPQDLVNYKIQKMQYEAEKEYSEHLREKFLSKIGYSDDVQAQEFVKSAASGNIKQCLLMIEKGINVNVNTVDGTALIAATKSEHIDICELLLDKGACVNIYDISKKTPLMYAARSGNVEICKLFMGYKANIDISVEHIVGPTGYVLRQCLTLADKNQLEIHNLFVEYHDKFGVNLFDCLISKDPNPKGLSEYTHGCKYLHPENDVHVSGEDSIHQDSTSWGCNIL